MDEDLAEDGETDAFPDGKADGGIDEGSPEALGVLALVNDPTMSASDLKTIGHVTSRVGTNISKHRDGADGKAATADDDKFDTLAELDAIPYVGPSALQALLKAAKDRGLVKGGAQIDLIFSPKPAAESHNARIAKLIGEAQHSVDIAIYSYSDAGIAAALKAAVGRGVKVRFLFDTARDDKGVTDPTARAATKSGRIEADGVDVRYVNKILHHKFIIVDGPRDDVSLAATAKIVTGSANWSNTGGSVFDENTFFIRDSEEVSASYQHEFDALWTGSREFTGPAAPAPKSTSRITTDDVADEAGLEVLFTRSNMKPGGADGATWSTNKDSLVMSDHFVAAIQRATTSIHVGSTHLRLRPVAEALIAKKQANPSIDIKVYLDQQEWISVSGDSSQKADVAACKAAATTPAQIRDCSYNDFLFSKALVDAGIDVRFKTYSYRWDASFAAQMHSKYIVVDGNELISGSYNLSMNSEHDTFENALHLTGPQFKPLIGQFEQNFATMFEARRTGGTALADLRTQISTSATIPLAWDPLAMTWSEFDSIRTLVRTNCTLADSQEYRDAPAAHKTCPR